jgi:hypothetical protein
MLKSTATIVAGPVAGLAYVVLLPFIAIGTVVVLAGAKALSGLVTLTGRSISFGWRPAVSYLSGRKKKGGK